MGILSEGKNMQTFNISANVIPDNSTKLILFLRESHKGVNDKDKRTIVFTFNRIWNYNKIAEKEYELS
jgi:hypothetical protein